MNRFLRVAVGGMFVVALAPEYSPAQVPPDTTFTADNSTNAPGAHRFWERPHSSSRGLFWGTRSYHHDYYPRTFYTVPRDPGHWTADDADPNYFGFFVNGIQVAGYNAKTGVYRTYNAATDTWSPPLRAPWQPMVTWR